ncbi:uncharacterized protein LOC132729259 isoform X2 [Ruditapes philippinarum]|uniref:uncharacterized protein LOC132729259 isoform X2 n=1 Tax=Ruditapes philippinarum TaxID=129788 RepID=UPI00295B17B6|nr:uncharacterized protein LOC132729259 isoform X2 [Ruditapes philippinarum]
MNQPRGNISSESDEDLDYVDGVGAQPTGQKEQHSDKHCKYKRSSGIVNGKEVVRHIRICKCGNFYDMRYLEESDDFTNINGREFHFSTCCKWKRQRKQTNGRKFYILHRFCGCISPQTSQSTSQMNRVPPSWN